MLRMDVEMKRSRGESRLHQLKGSMTLGKVLNFVKKFKSGKVNKLF